MSLITRYTLLNGCAVVVLAVDSMQDRSGSFDLVTGVGTAIMMKSAFPISSGLSVKAMPGLSFA